MRLRIRSLWPAGFALAGMAGGHWLGYVLALPDAGHRGQILAQTGHQWWGLVLATAALAGASGLAWLVARSFKAGTRGRAFATPALGSLVLRLGALQVSLFVALELVERAFSPQASLPTLVFSRPFLVGVAVQMVVAALAAVVIRAAARAATAAGRLFRVRPRHTTVALVPTSSRTTPRPILVLAGAAGLRGPPTR